jgi:hypothetical protein
MLKKYAILIGILLSVALFVVAAIKYPGGSQRDKNSIGYDWKNNYVCNLFDSKAVNGTQSSSRPWADSGMIVLGATFALFFYRSSKKMPSTGIARLIKYVGVGAMVLAVLVVTPLHDVVVTVSGTGAVICIFYISALLFRSKLLFMKVLSAACLLMFYCCSVIYYFRYHLELLPVMQKVWLLFIVTWTLCVEHFTTAADYQTVKKTIVVTAK